MPLSTLIFDFDGTIANSLDATLRIANELAPEYGYRPARAEELEVLRSSSYRAIASELGMAWHKIPLIAARIRKELSGSVSEMETFDGMPEVLSELRARGFTLGILTTNDRRNVERFLAARTLEQFEFISTSSSVWGKARRLKSLLRSRNLNASEVAYVGDEVRDIEATRSLGICMIAVSWGYARASLLSAHTPDHLVARPADLLDLSKLS